MAFEKFFSKQYASRVDEERRKKLGRSVGLSPANGQTCKFRANESASTAHDVFVLLRRKGSGDVTIVDVGKRDGVETNEAAGVCTHEGVDVVSSRTVKSEEKKEKMRNKNKMNKMSKKKTMMMMMKKKEETKK